MMLTGAQLYTYGTPVYNHGTEWYPGSHLWYSVVLSFTEGPQVHIHDAQLYMYGTTVYIQGTQWYSVQGGSNRVEDNLLKMLKC